VLGTELGSGPSATVQLLGGLAAPNRSDIPELNPRLPGTDNIGLQARSTEGPLGRPGCNCSFPLLMDSPPS